MTEKNNNEQEKNTQETKEKPVKEGQKLIIEIQNEGMKGDGITRIEGFAIITKRAEKGKRYEVEITGVYATYAFARMIREIKKSPTITEEEL